jgi:hypothetical protein
LKIVKGWRKMDRQRGFVNETTGQNLVVTKKEFGEHYVVLLFPRVRVDDKGEIISPAYATASKAEACALNWMEKHPRGAESAVERTSDGGDENE